METFRDNTHTLHIKAKMANPLDLVVIFFKGQEKTNTHVDFKFLQSTDVSFHFCVLVFHHLSVCLSMDLIQFLRQYHTHRKKREEIKVKGRRGEEKCHDRMKRVIIC